MDTTISGGNKRALQRRAVRNKGWTKARRQRFLDTLAATCNVLASSAAAGIPPTNAYRLRQRDPGFAALWQEALTLGYERLEQALLTHALESINAIEIAADGPVDLSTGVTDPKRDTAAERAQGFPGSGAPRALAGSADGSGGGPVGGRISMADAQFALMLLNRHRAAVEGRAAPSGGRASGQGRPTAEQTDAVLRKKLDALARRLGPKA